MNLYADEFTDHPMLIVTCHDTPMVVHESYHGLETLAGKDTRVHRIVRRCIHCGTMVMTSLMSWAPAQVDE